MTTTPEAFADLLTSRPPADAIGAAEDLVRRGMAARALYLDVLAPALEVVGARWHSETATVAQEHVATATVKVIMARLSPLPPELPPVGHCIVLSCTDTEFHDVGLRMVGDFLDADGWESYYLGASTPMRDLAALVRQVRPDAVGLSTTMDTHLPLARAAISAIRATTPSIFILVGGAAYGRDAEVANALGADAFAPNAAAASTLLRHRFDQERQGLR